MKPFTLFIKFTLLMIHLLSQLIHCLKQLTNHSTAKMSQHSTSNTGVNYEEYPNNWLTGDHTWLGRYRILQKVCKTTPEFVISRQSKIFSGGRILHLKFQKFTQNLWRLGDRRHCACLLLEFQPQQNKDL